MILLYALIAGVAAGLVLHGSLGRFADVQVRWAPVVLVAFAAQLIAFSEPVGRHIGDLGPSVYVVSTVAVFVAVLRNIRLTGVPLVAAGGLSNLVAVLANGGYMPASAPALLAAGRTIPEGYSNSTESVTPAFGVLTDVFATPSWLPAANVFSIGDVMIGLGLIVAIVAIMRGDAGASAKLPQKDRAPGTHSS